MFTSKCASRPTGVHFFDISSAKSRPAVTGFYTFYLQILLRATMADTFSTTSKSGPNLTCFDRFHFQMCFAPQRRAIFPHLNFRKCAQHALRCHFLLPNVFRAATACNFQSLIWPAGSAAAALQAYFSTLQSHNTLFRDFLTFRAPAPSLSSDFLHPFSSPF